MEIALVLLKSLQMFLYPLSKRHTVHVDQTLQGNDLFKMTVYKSCKTENVLQLPVLS